MERLFDFNHPFFRPLWLRILIVAVCLLWAMFEASTGQMMWAILFGAIGLYAAYGFFVTFNPREPEDK
ncbi:hypothetical protein FHG66_06860 [Rubellimicrobium rubrum]|uniref:DUF3329 domain-containing protein n=1 Tax=Rubellimicrobium rubrum TaxID=2585369 RepID=A0A5C4N019_9RHOB|nr:hypothetical protein [Rubellimicrobium rubrum]TNC50691.1 hypothetical protein FHG66_06860 [Rubellimicrobium rubrum]